MTRLLTLAALLGTVLLAGLLAGCSGSTSSQESDVSGGSGDSLAEPAPARTDGVGMDGLAQGGATGSQGAARGAVLEPAIVRTATVEVRSDDVSTDRAEVQRITDRHGGTVSEQETYTDDSGKAESARLVLRVPEKEFQTMVDELEEVGELASSTTSSQDVTNQLVDTKVRIDAQRASIARIQELLSRAETIGDVVRIEGQLTQRQADLDSLLAQQAQLTDRSSLSTITVSLFRDAPATKPAEDRGGFLGGLAAGWGALKDFGSGLALVAGALLPWLPVIALAAAPLVWAVRRRRTPGDAAAPEPAQANG